MAVLFVMLVEISTTSLQLKSVTKNKKQPSAWSAGRRRVRGLLPSSSILKNKPRLNILVAITLQSHINKSDAAEGVIAG
jgi:hypothetical protein